MKKQNIDFEIPEDKVFTDEEILELFGEEALLELSNCAGEEDDE